MDETEKAVQEVGIVEHGTAQIEAIQGPAPNRAEDPRHDQQIVSKKEIDNSISQMLPPTQQNEIQDTLKSDIIESQQPAIVEPSTERKAAITPNIPNPPSEIEESMRNNPTAAATEHHRTGTNLSNISMSIGAAPTDTKPASIAPINSPNQNVPLSNKEVQNKPSPTPKPQATPANRYQIKRQLKSPAPSTEGAEPKQLQLDLPGPDPSQHLVPPSSTNKMPPSSLLRPTPNSGFYSKTGFTDDVRRSHRLEQRNKLMRDQMAATFRLLQGQEPILPQAKPGTARNRINNKSATHRGPVVLQALGSNPNYIPITPEQYEEWHRAELVRQPHEVIQTPEFDPIKAEWKETYRLRNIRQKPQYDGLSRDNWTQREYMRQVHGVDMVQRQQRIDQRSDQDISRRKDPPPRPEYYHRQQMYLRSHYGILIKKTLQKSLSQRQESKAPQGTIYRSTDIFSPKLTSKPPPNQPQLRRSFYLGPTAHRS